MAALGYLRKIGARALFQRGLASRDHEVAGNRLAIVKRKIAADDPAAHGTDHA